ncbi:MAG TPA: hypothetical protein VEI02_15640 [Planctomycetota bacterium]|nr:hypothetical protein [Planctomycetota bacterium]
MPRVTSRARRRLPSTVVVCAAILVGGCARHAATSTHDATTRQAAPEAGILTTADVPLPPEKTFDPPVPDAPPLQRVEWEPPPPPSPPRTDARFPKLDAPFASWPADLAASRPVRREQGPPWSWPSSQDFAAARADVRDGRAPYLCVGVVSDAEIRARVSLYGRRYVHGDVQGVVLSLAAVDWDGPSPPQAIAARLLGASARFPTPEPEAFSELELFPWRAAPVRIVDVVWFPRAAPPEEAVVLRGYVLALLRDSPGDPELSESQCSMDATPAYEAAEFAREAAESGALGRFLRLRLKIVGDAFDRPVASTYGDAAHAPHPDALAKAPVDLAAFFAALCFDYVDPLASTAPVGPDRLGRAIAAAGLAPRLAPWVRARAEDPKLDVWNRLRMVQVLASILGHSGTGDPESCDSWTATRAEVAERLQPLAVPEPARWWIASL